ncbi:MAG: hypothetical protein ACREMF_02020 [Gemmatimonadales bacterium]
MRARVACWMLLGGVWAPWALAQAGPASQSALIEEGHGAVGRLRVGAPVDILGAGLAPVPGAANTYRSTDGHVVVRADAAGNVIAIRVEGGELFTTHLVRPGVSTLADVLGGYGRPASTRRQDGVLVLGYPGIEFSFPYAGSGPLSDDAFKQVLATRVSAITLLRRAP